MELFLNNGIVYETILSSIPLQKKECGGTLNGTTVMAARVIASQELYDQPQHTNGEPV
jgi:hypothetical protein